MMQHGRSEQPVEHSQIKHLVSTSKEPYKRDNILQKRPIAPSNGASEQSVEHHQNKHLVSTSKEPYKRDNILQKSPIKETIFCKRDL